tara:strand:- start:93 stop:359 length:267 start_codon:yes stop_codon:yes gene_type:complete
MRDELRDEDGDGDGDEEEVLTIVSDQSEAAPTCLERFGEGVRCVAREAPGWFALAIVLTWLLDAFVHWEWWSQWIDQIRYGNIEVRRR